jgi:hypothetical protein
MKKIVRYIFAFSVVAAMSVLTVLALRDRVNVLTGGDAKTYTLTLDDANLKDMPTDTATTPGIGYAWTDSASTKDSADPRKIAFQGSCLNAFMDFRSDSRPFGADPSFDSFRAIYNQGYIRNITPLHGLISVKIRYAHSGSYMQTQSKIDNGSTEGTNYLEPSLTVRASGTLANTATGELNDPITISNFVTSEFQYGFDGDQTTASYYTLTYYNPTGANLSYLELLNDSGSFCMVAQIVYTYSCIDDAMVATSSSEVAVTGTGVTATGGTPFSF